MTPYEKIARYLLARALHAPVDDADKTHLVALENEMIEHERVLLNEQTTGIENDVK